MLKLKQEIVSSYLAHYYISPDPHKILGILIHGLELPVLAGN
ncbi:hypothetical protein [Leptodesmis sp.]